jgi:hypothetical protein
LDGFHLGFTVIALQSLSFFCALATVLTDIPQRSAISFWEILHVPNFLTSFAMMRQYAIPDMVSRNFPAKCGGIPPDAAMLLRICHLSRWFVSFTMRSVTFLQGIDEKLEPYEKLGESFEKEETSPITGGVFVCSGDRTGD